MDVGRQADGKVALHAGLVQPPENRNDILGPRRGLILYDFTTSDPTYTRKLARRAAKKGVTYMDAGMTGGGAKGADEGTMTLMIGGDEKTYRRTAPLLAP